MPAPNGKDECARRAKIETFESRMMMTADALVNVDPIEVDPQHMADSVEIAPSLHQIQTASNNDSIADYQFDGAGQTVAVIDSGIAWDHYALGGGFGKGNRVVGGWDFAENDANPYDDGPAGYHGTHVAGVIGSTDSNAQGVATGVDLVGLRIFDDYGKSSFDWVEDALQWVHDHKDDFENPITTVNMSLGIKWNSNSIPEWTQIEDELAQLEKDGIFVSVAAGNFFKDYNSKGLSYPAASEHVVPVSSHDSSGNMSDFSQRNNRVLVAPGEKVLSTVPEHIVGGSGAAKSFFSASGTSMAAPYVAGASTLVREAMEFMGEKNITQDDIYDVFRKSSDRIYDNATKSYYHRVDVEAALNLVVGDDYGHNMKNAGDFGTLKNTMSIDGTIGKTNDVDYLSFKAGKTGTVEFTVNQTNDLNAEVNLVGGKLTQNGNRYSMEVEAGKDYVLNVRTTEGIGHYELKLNLESNSTDANNRETIKTTKRLNWGTVDAGVYNDIDVTGRVTGTFKAANDGIATIEMTNGQNRRAVNIEVYDGQNNKVTSVKSQNGNRLDFTAKAGEKYTLRMVGESDNVDVRVTNIVRQDGGDVYVKGTRQADRVRIKIGDQVEMNVNGTRYSFARTELDSIEVRGRGGKDTLRIEGSNRTEIANMFGRRVELKSGGLEISGRSADSIYIDGNGGNDRVHIKDTANVDYLNAKNEWARLHSSKHSNTVNDFEQIKVESRSGNDKANFDGVNPNSVVRVVAQEIHNDTDYNFTISGFKNVGGLNVTASLAEKLDELFPASSQNPTIVKEQFFSELLSQSDRVGNDFDWNFFESEDDEKEAIDSLFEDFGT